MTAAPEQALLEQVRLADGAFYAGDPHPAYAALRAHAPVFRDPTSGLWGIATYDAVSWASLRPEVFSSAGGSRPYNGPLPHMIDMDDPAHHQRRLLVSKGFTPRRIAERHDHVLAICDELIDRVCERGSADLVRDIAAQLPLIVIGDLLGILPEDRADLLRWSEDMLAGQGELNQERVARAATALQEYRAYAVKVITDRRAHPSDDLISVLVRAEIDGRRLSDDELIGETLLILVGGDETTRHVIAGGVEQLLRHREHWERLQEHRAEVPLAVEEMLRWVSPIKNMCRTLTRDVELGGQVLPAGEQALLLYESANYDETRFVDPGTFDPLRRPNNHLAFGVGPHFCLGASLARLELSVLLNRLLDRLPDLELASAAPLERRKNAFISGIEHMPVTFSPTAPLGLG